MISEYHLPFRIYMNFCVFRTSMVREIIVCPNTLSFRHHHQQQASSKLSVTKSDLIISGCIPYHTSLPWTSWIIMVVVVRSKTWQTLQVEVSVHTYIDINALWWTRYCINYSCTYVWTQVIRVHPIHMQKLRKLGNVKGRGKKHDGLQWLKKRGMKK